MNDFDSRGRVHRSAARVVIPRAVAGAALFAGVLVALPLVGGENGTPLGRDGTAYAAGALKPFSTCDTVLEYFKDQAPEYLIERAGRGYAIAEMADAGAGRAAAPGADSGGAAESGMPPAHSTTNVQEAGVDEPDIVKTDGNRIVAVAKARVHLVGVTGGTMTLRKTLPDTMVRNVFLSGDRVLVFSGQQGQSFESDLGWPGQKAVLTMYDISNIGDPQLLATLTLDGDVLDARLVGTQVRVDDGFVARR